MPKLLWGCYSVADHLGPRPFVADLILYDRLVIPTPADDDHDRWERNGWDPDKLDRMLAILGPFAERIEWSTDLRERWDELYRDPSEPSEATELVSDIAQSRPGAFFLPITQSRPGALPATRQVMSEQLANRVSAEMAGGIKPEQSIDVRGVAVYGSPDRFDVQWRWRWAVPFLRKDVMIQAGEFWEAGGPLEPRPEERAKVVVTRLAVPDDKDLSDEEVLRRAVRFVKRRDVREKRAELHEFVSSLDEEGVSTDTVVREMNWLLGALNEIARTKAKAERARMVVQAVTVAQGAIALKVPEVAPVQGLTAAVGEAFVQRRWGVDEHAPGLGAAALLKEAKRALSN